MYDLPEVRRHTDALWAAIAAAAAKRGLDPPPRLSRFDDPAPPPCEGEGHGGFEDDGVPDLRALAAAPLGGATGAAAGQRARLFLSQTCGLPLVSVHRDALTVVAVPRYAAKVAP